MRRLAAALWAVCLAFALPAWADDEPPDSDEGAGEEPSDSDEGAGEEPSDSDEGAGEEPSDSDEGSDPGEAPAEPPSDSDEGEPPAEPPAGGEAAAAEAAGAEESVEAQGAEPVEAQGAEPTAEPVEAQGAEVAAEPAVEVAPEVPAPAPVAEEPPSAPAEALAPGTPGGWPRLADSNPDGSPTSTKAARPKFTDFVRSVLTFYVGDDNLLAGNEDGSPRIGIGDEYPELFFEGLNAEKRKVVTESHLVLYGKMPGFLPFVDTEGAFVAEFELSRDPEDGRLVSSFRDDGSWLAVTFWFNRLKKGKNLKLTAWPFSADRFRLGYLFDLTWGGNQVYADNFGPVPGFKLHLDLERFYAFVGAKSMPRLRADNDEIENYWGLLAGLGPNVWFGPGNKMQLRYDVGGGYFQRGTFKQDPFRSTPLQGFGISQRVLLSYNTPRMGQTADLRLLKSDPENRRRASFVPLYNHGSFGFGVSAEFTSLWQTLIDPETLDGLVFDNGLAAALNAQVRFLKNMRVGLDVVYRDVSFMLFNVPGLTPYVAFAEDTIRKPQVYGALWWSYYIEPAHLTPGFVLGLMQPASFEAEEDATGNRQTQVIREASDYEILPVGESPFTILSLKGSLQWNLSHMLAIIGEVAFTQDFNVTKVAPGEQEGETASRVIDTALGRAVGLNLIMQAQF